MHPVALDIITPYLRIERVIRESRCIGSSCRAGLIDGRREETWQRMVICNFHYYLQYTEQITAGNYVARTRSRPLLLPIRQTPAHTRYVRPMCYTILNQWQNYQAFRSQFGSCTKPPNTRLPVCSSGCPTTIFRNLSSPRLRSSITASSNRFR